MGLVQGQNGKAERRDGRRDLYTYISWKIITARKYKKGNNPSELMSIKVVSKNFTVCNHANFLRYLLEIPRKFYLSLCAKSRIEHT